MPRLQARRRHQKALLWAASATDVSDAGARKVSAAIEIDVRWEDVQTEITDSQGNVISVVAKVIVDQDVTIGSIMWLGTHETVADPPVDLKKVVAFSNIPDVKGRSFRKKVMLARFSNTLPTIA